MDVPRVAERQAGAFTQEQALAEGWSLSQVRRRVAARAWLRLPGGALAAADPAPEPLTIARGLSLVWPETVACFRTAAVFWRLPVEQDGTVHVRAGRGRRAPGVTVHRPHDEDGTWTTPSGLHLTDWTATATDCLALAPLDDALDLYAWLLTRKKMTHANLRRAAADRSPRKGTAQLQRLTALTRHGAVSAAEHRFHLLLDAAGLTGWEANADVVDRHGRRAVVDVLFREARVAVEIDGFRAHRERDRFVADARRHNRVGLAGYAVLRFTWWDVTERPDEVVAEVRDMLARA